MILIWNANVHNLLGKPQKKSLATHSNNEGLNLSENHQAKDFLFFF